MILTNKQEEGLKISVARYKAGEAYTCIAGYAGTGKSTLIKFIIAALGLLPEDVCYVAYTGKAAQVLRQKGCPNPITAHKLLYTAKPMPNGTYKFEPRASLEKEYKLIVVDEVSMIPATMWRRLLTHRVHVLATGDPGQLPPPTDDTNTVLDKPHVFLDEIMRQAYDSEIIRLSMWIREGRPLAEFKGEGKDVMIISPRAVTDSMLAWADQILCATNATRNTMNGYIRKSRGYSNEPQLGDKVICLHNQWEFLSHGKDPSPLTNGTISEIQSMMRRNVYAPKWACEKPIPIMYTNLISETGDAFDYVPIDYTALTTGNKFLSGPQEYKMKRNKQCPTPPFEFSYAYCITTWKGQGSEWNKVLGYEERFPFDKEEHKKYLYTMCTRAKERLVVVKQSD